MWLIRLSEIGNQTAPMKPANEAMGRPVISCLVDFEPSKSPSSE